MSDDPRVDAIWELLAPHVEWARGFSLILLFANHPDPVAQIRSRLEASLRANGRSLTVHELRPKGGIRDFALTVLAKSEPDSGALWIPLWWRGSDKACDFLLARLNERRFLLERDVARPVVLILPTDYRSKVYVLAPDLWTVRTFTTQLPDPVALPGEPRPHVLESQDQFVSRPPGLAEVEWRRLVSASGQTGLDVEDGFRAFEAARLRGSLWDARRIAIETLTLAVRGAVDGAALATDIVELVKEAQSLDSRAQRYFAGALDNLAIVEEEAGNSAGAHELYRRSLEIREALAKAAPASPTAQRDLSMSLGALAGVEERAGNLAGARELYRRSLQVCAALATADPQQAEAQRDLSISLANVGRTEARAGNLQEALELHRRSLEIREALAKAAPANATAQRDLAGSLSDWGEMQWRAGNLVAARELFRRSLEIGEALANAEPHNAQALRDLSSLLIKLGGVEQLVGNLPVARELCRRSLAIAQGLAKADAHNSMARFDVVPALIQLALVAKKLDDFDECRDCFRRANAILDDLDANGQLDGYADRELIRQIVQTRLTALEKLSETSS